jgi:two-component system, NarL family, sensor histidine kinase NreB
MAAGTERGPIQGCGRAGSLRESNLALHRINDILEEQSRRIAHAVHDEAGQLLAAVFLRLDQASRELAPGCKPCFDEIKGMLQMIEVQLREIAHDLRPTILDDLGLVPAISAYIDRVSKRHGIAITCESAVPGRLSAPVETTIYRIVQESLNNVVKHANANRADIRISHDGRIVECLIQDNGGGFEVTEVLSRKGSRGLGLLGIRERVESVGGELAIRSLPGNGTTLLITIPTGD